MLSQNNVQDSNSSSGDQGAKNGNDFFVQLSNEIKNTDIKKKQLIERLNDYLVSAEKKVGQN
jgi:hypothetical protein